MQKQSSTTVKFALNKLKSYNQYTRHLK